MYEHLSVVGQRGQITLPKDIREKEGIRPKDKVLIRLDDDRIVVEKTTKAKDQKALLIEGYKKMAHLALETEKEWAYASSEADAMLDDY